MNNSNQKRIERIADQLFEIKSRINARDREDAARELRKSIYSVNNYLNRRVYDEVLGLELLRFFKERIAQRENVLND